jgi:hypothetical protein
LNGDIKKGRTRKYVCLWGNQLLNDAPSQRARGKATFIQFGLNAMDFKI